MNTAFSERRVPRHQRNASPRLGAGRRKVPIPRERKRGVRVPLGRPLGATHTCIGDDRRPPVRQEVWTRRRTVVRVMANTDMPPSLGTGKPDPAADNRRASTQ